MCTLSSISQSYCKGNTQPVTLWSLLFEGRGANPARPVLMATLGLDAASADFLAACLYWQLKVGQAFYKFNAPCGHARYRAGDSWQEELGMSEHTFYRARSAVATKNSAGHDLATTLGSRDTSTLVIFWTDAQRVTWYDVRLELVAEKLSQALEVEICVGVEQIEGHTARAVPDTGVTDRPEGRTQAVPPVPGPAQVAASPIQPGTPNPESPGLLMKPQIPGITYLHTEEEVREIREIRERVPGVVRRIAERLQQEGVYETPALHIARRAQEGALDDETVAALYQAHLRSLQAAGKPREECIPIAVWRMKCLPLQTPSTPPVPQRSRSARGGTAARRSGQGLSAPERGGRACNPIATEFRERLSATPTGFGEGARAIGPAQPLPASSPIPPPPRASLHEQWERVQRELELGLSRAVYHQHLRGARLVEVAGDQCTIAVRSQSSLAWLEHRLKRRIESVLAYQLGRPVQPSFVCEEA